MTYTGPDGTRLPATASRLTTLPSRSGPRLYVRTPDGEIALVPLDDVELAPPDPETPHRIIRNFDHVRVHGPTGPGPRR